VLDRGFVHVFVAGGVFAKLVSPANDASRFTDKIACQAQSRRANSPGDDKQSAAHDDSCFPLISISAAFAIEIGLGNYFCSAGVEVAGPSPTISSTVSPSLAPS
jgi:hypothetical protein